MKSAKHPQLPHDRNSRINLPASRRTTPSNDPRRETVERTTSEVDPELLLHVLNAFRKGDFTVRMPSNLTGIPGKIADLLNEVIENEARLTNEFVRVAQVVGKEGKMSQRVNVGNVGGSWAE